MNKLLLLTLLSLILWSCEDTDKATITIENNSSYEKTNCKVFSEYGESLVKDSISFGTIEKQGKSMKIWATKLPSSDGTLYLKLIQNNKSIKKYFCYFSNGGFIQKTHKISVSDNEIHVD